MKTLSLAKTSGIKVKDAGAHPAPFIEALISRACDTMESISLTKSQWDFIVSLSGAKFENLPSQIDGAFIKKLRRVSGLSQQSFAERLGVAASTVRQWEKKARGVEVEDPANKMEAIAPEPLTLLSLIRRQELNISEFAEIVEKAWAPISGRSLSRESVGSWINGRNSPRLEPSETLAITKILDCSLEEFAQSIENSVSQKKFKTP